MNDKVFYTKSAIVLIGLWALLELNLATHTSLFVSAVFFGVCAFLKHLSEIEDKTE